MLDKIQTTGLDIPALTMSKQEFFALAEKRIRDNAGSGFAEWGGHYNSSSASYDIVNEGISCRALGAESWVNQIRLGSDSSSTTFNGKSRTKFALVPVNGVLHKIERINTSASDRSYVNFPPAPDGTKTYDSSTGVVVQHADSVTAFASETATNKVIISRKDFVLIEQFHEKISDKDQVYPLGGIQRGTSTYKGISLINTLVAQGYSAFGEWDSVTKGYSAKWSTLSDEDKLTFVQDEDNNIYEEDGELIQVRYRIRVIEGLGDEWSTVNPQDATGLMRYGVSNATRVPTMGKRTTTDDYLNSSTRYFSTSRDSLSVIQNTGMFTGRADNATAHNGLCFAVPIALVQRRNQGGYYPVYNPTGTKGFQTSGDAGASRDWYATDSLKPSNISECFTYASTSVIGGTISGGVNRNTRPDDKFYDAIYSSDVQDLRMSSRRVPLEQIRETYKRKAIAGEVRGYEGVPVTQVFTTDNSNDVGVIDTNTIRFWADKFLGLAGDDRSKVHSVYVEGSDGVYHGGTVITNVVSDSRFVDVFAPNHSYANAVITTIVVGNRIERHSQDKPTWTDIIGDPTRIAATFPDGVEGQWISTIPNGSFITFKGNRKSTTKKLTIITDDNGGTWVTSTLDFTGVTNSFQILLPATRVQLMHYETKAHFTTDDTNSEVLQEGKVWFNERHQVDSGNALCSSLLGKILDGNDGNNQNRHFGDITAGYAGSFLSTGTDKRKPTHSAIDINAANGTGTAIKAWDYLSETSEVAKLCYLYKELNYDVNKDNITDTIVRNSATSYAYSVVGTLYSFNNGLYSGGVYRLEVNSGTLAVDTALYEGANGNLYRKSNNALTLKLWNGLGWGDNDQFEVNNNQVAITDDNGNTVLSGTASFNTQFFIDRSDI